MAWSQRLAGGLIATGAAAATCLTSARASIPTPPPPTLADIVEWILSGNDLLALSGAAVAGISAGYSVWQMFQSSPASTSEVTGLVDRLSDRVDHAGKASEERDHVTHRLLTGGLVERVRAAIEAGTLSDEERAGLVAAVAQSVESETDASPQIAATFAEAVGILAQSVDPRERAIAAQAVGGDPIEAADQLMAEVSQGRARNAERARQAARLYAPFALQRAITAYREATDLEPDDAMSWIELSRLYRWAESPSEMRRCALQALQHAKTERERAIAENDLGNAALVVGDWPEARRRYEAYNAIATRLAEAEPENPDYQRDLAISHNKLGDVTRAMGDLASAKAHYEIDLQIAERLAAEFPLATLHRDLYLSHDRLGQMAVDEGDMEEAARRFNRSLAITERLVANEPRDVELKRDVLVSHNRLGELAWRKRDIAGTRRHYEAALAIGRELAALDDANSTRQVDLALLQRRLGDVAAAENDVATARQWYESAREAGRRAGAADAENAHLRSVMASINEALGNLPA